MIKYRKITELTYNEIKEIINDIFKPINIIGIFYNDNSVSVAIETNWEYYDSDSNKKIILINEEDITLTDPFVSDGLATEFEYSFTYDEIIRYKKFCLAKGVCELYLTDNPYLENE